MKKFKRKFDSDIKNEMRILEELYYHSAYNSRYIQELHQALRATGITPEITREISLQVKDDFKNSTFWKEDNLFVNKKITNDRSNISDFSDINIQTSFKYSLYTGYAQDKMIFEQNSHSHLETQTTTFRLKTFDQTIIRKAIYQLDFYKFSNLLVYFPKLTSVSEFITSEKFLANIEVEVTGLQHQLKELNSIDKLDIVKSVIKKLISEFRKEKNEFIGTYDFIPIAIKECVKDKTLNISIEKGQQEIGVAMRETTNNELNLNLSDKEWYIYDENYGTSEEKYFIKFLHNAIDKLKKQFKDVYLLRNEKLFQLYRFSDGKALEPDFVLFLKNNTDSIMYQLFIEAKGEHLLNSDRWKEEFLESIKLKYKIMTLFEGKKFRIIGMPFYNQKMTKSAFTDKFESILQIQLKE